MDIWRFFQLLCIVSASLVSGNVISENRTSDSLENGSDLLSLFDESAHVPGEPLSPIDYQNAEAVSDDHHPPSHGNHSDPIEIAGLFEGDIILSTTKNGVIYEKQKWSNRIVPYLISDEFDAFERSVIAKAFSEYHKNTCIKFKPRAAETDYIHITKGNGCSSLVGKAGGAQPVSLGRGCVYPGIAIHELMHAVGFWHEQSRWDRDDHVTVYFENIQHGMDFNFRKYNWQYIQNLSAEYDLGSVMHYGAYAFSKDRRSATILPKNPNQKIGQRENFSQTDIMKINRLYSCDGNKPTQPTPTTKPPQAGCVDNHKHCEYWANNGECIKNGAWMLVNCKKSCKQCNKPCGDLNQYCGVWARKGDCSRNSEYMNNYCSKSCKTCKNKEATAPPNLVCEDREKYCAYWASVEECRKNPKYMGKYCPKSCRLC